MARSVTQSSGVNQEHLGHRVRLLRARAGVTQAALADAIGITREAISMLERRREADWAARARRLASALRCHPGELFAPMPEMSDEELAVLRKFRSLNPHARETVLELIDQLAPAMGRDRRAAS